MSFRIPDGWKEPRIEPFVSFNGIEQNIEEIPDGSISLDFYIDTDIRANTPGNNGLLKKYSNATLAYITEEYLNHCSHKDDVTYDGALQLRIVPELLERIKDLSESVEWLEGQKYQGGNNG